MDTFVIADLSSTMATVTYILQVAAGLGFVIFVHELGHFLAAKACGVKCEKFYVGFDIPIKIGPISLPSSLVKFRWGETVYGVGILPLGGYVKMLGQDDNPTAQAAENEKIRVRKPGEQAEGAAADSSSEFSRDAEMPSADVANCAAEEEFEWDPRSYPAKPVWQRMIIISAGVIMNVIFGMIFAAAAYKMGVKYEPTLIGQVSPGDPAWEAGLSPGDKIVGIGPDAEPNEKLRFLQDLVQNVVLNGAKEDLVLAVRPRGSSEIERVALRPSERMRPIIENVTVGITPSLLAKLAKEKPVLDNDQAGFKQLKGGDRVIAVDDIPLPLDDETGAAFVFDFKRLIAPRCAQPVKLTVLRQSGKNQDGTTEQEQVDVELPPSPMNRLGLHLKLGAVLSVRKGSPAAAAGVQVGDVIVGFADQAIEDPMTIQQRLLDHVGKEIPLRVERKTKGTSETVELQITPESPMTYHLAALPGSLLGIESLGVACSIGNELTGVDADSPAADAGLQAGDQLVSLQLLAPRDQDGKAKESDSSVIELADYAPETPIWPYFHTNLQAALPGTQVAIVYRRGDEQNSVQIEPEESEVWFNASRGVRMTKYEQIRVADNWSEAMALGVRETKEQFYNMKRVLGGLFSGRVSVKSLGGPIMIAVAAGSEASHGLPRLLIFLTLLSVNLAVLNFLPIPALDGGHMVFLAAEAVRGKPVDERLQIALTIIGVGCLLSLMAFVFVLDIQRFFL